MQRQGGGGKKMLCDCEEVGSNTNVPRTTTAVIESVVNRPAAVTTAVAEVVAKRKQAQATKDWQTKSARITELVKNILKERGRKLPSGFHLKVAGYMKPRLGNANVTRENVAAAINYLNANPNYKSTSATAKKNKSKPAATTAAVQQNSAPRLASLLSPIPEGTSNVNATAAETQRRNNTTVRRNNNNANKTPSNNSEEEEAELQIVNIAGQEFFWNETSKNIYESLEGSLGDRIGIWPGGDAPIEYQGGGGLPAPDSCPYPYPGVCDFYAKGGGCGCGAGLLPQAGGGCGCSAGPTGPLFQGGYRATARNLKYLKRWKQGKSIGFTMTASLKAKGLIPRTSKTKKGKKVVSKKYKTRRNRVY